MDYQEIFKSKNVPCEVILHDTAGYLFKASDIGKILNIKNIHSTQISECYKVKVTTLTNGGNQSVMFYTEDGVKQLLSRTRKANACALANIFGVQVFDQISIDYEASTLAKIKTSFEGETMIEQYTVGSYRIDLYFPKYKLAIECDEKQHGYTANITSDQVRQSYIEDKLKCKFLRYKPHDDDFDIFVVIQSIFNHIKLHSVEEDKKSKISQEHCDRLKRKNIRLSSKLDGYHCRVKDLIESLYEVPDFDREQIMRLPFFDALQEYYEEMEDSLFTPW